MPSAPQKSQLINKQSLNLELYTPKSYKEIQNMEITRPKNSTKSSTPPSSAIGKKLEAQPTHIDSARIEKNKKITQNLLYRVNQLQPSQLQNRKTPNHNHFHQHKNISVEKFLMTYLTNQLKQLIQI